MLCWIPKPGYAAALPGTCAGAAGPLTASCNALLLLQKQMLGTTSICLTELTECSEKGKDAEITKTMLEHMWLVCHLSETNANAESLPQRFCLRATMHIDTEYEKLNARKVLVKA